MSVAYNSSIITSGLLLCLDAGNPRSYSGSGSVWFDISGNNNNATLYNATYSSGYMIFNGTSTYATVTNNVTNGTGNFTVSIWYYKLDTVQNRYLWDFGSNGGTLATGTEITQGARYYNPTIGASGNLYNSGPVLSANTWYNTIITRVSGITYLYQNGSLITSQSDSGSIGSWGTTLTIGNYGGGGNYYHNGRMSSLMVYNIGMSATNVVQNFEAYRGRFGV